MTRLRARPMRSTTAVLWLMIALIFGPIATAHGIARLLNGGEAEETGR
jgi:hypothetical protein